MSATTLDAKLDPKHNSRAFLEGPHRAAARAQLKGIGYDDEALSKPIIGVASTWIETMPCTYHLRALSARVKEGIRAAGGTPMEFNTVAISDGITMGTPGMRTSLVSREVIADSIELVAKGHYFDGIVALCGCDKTIPGTVMALARLNLPGRDALRRLDLARAAATARRSRSWRSSRRSARTPRARSPTRSSRRSRRPPRRASAPAAASSPPTRWRWRSRCSASRRCATPACPRSTTPRRTSPTATGQLIMDVLARGQRPSDIITRESLENAIAAVAMSGGSTNGVLHLLAVANEAGIELDIDDFDRISSKTPLTCDLSPGGRYLATHLHEAGGVPVVASRLLEAGLLHEGAQTVTGKTIGELARAAQETEGQQVVRPLSNPLKPTGGLAILRGNLAPEGCVVKLAGHERVHHSGPARVFDGEEGAMLAVTTGPDRGGRRGRDPQRGPRRRPRHARDARRHGRDRRRRARRQRRADHRRALLRRHARLHGRPRRARGRPRRPDRRRAEGDTVTIDVERPRGWTSTSPTRRSPSASPPTRRPTTASRGTGVLAKYAKLVSSAAEGAITR